MNTCDLRSSPTSGGGHEIPSTGAETIAIATSVSPFVPAATVERYKKKALDEVMADLVTPAEAASEAARRIDEEIRLTLKESPKLQRKFAKYSALQEQIDRYRGEGRKVPLEWIKNPFHQRYYLFKGWAEESLSE